MRRLAGLASLSMLLPLLACGSSSSVTVPDPAPTPAPEPTAVAPEAPAPRLSGTLLGHDGKPMKLAHVSIGDQHVQVAADGSFAMPDAKPGFAKVAFTGVDHGDKTVGVLLGDEPMVVNVVLGTYERPAAYEAPTVVQIVFGDGGISLGKAVPMTRADDGTWVADIKTAPGEYAYELRGIVAQRGRSMNGTAVTEYRYDGDGNYANVVTATAEPVRVVFDPKAVLPSNVSTQVTYADPTSTAAKVAEVYAGIEARNAALSERVNAERAKGAADVDPAALADTAWKAAYRAQIAAEQDATVRHAMFIAYFAAPADKEDAAEAALAAEAMAQIPPTSPLWAMHNESVVTIAGFAADAAAGRAYVDAVIAGIEDHNQGGSLVFGLMWNARREGRYDDVTHYYKVLHERFPTSSFIRVSAMFDPDKAVRVGAKIPDFDLASFDNSRKRFTQDSFAGKVVLVEFWATWCGPCIEEMPNMHAMHAKYKKQGFEILSICADDSADAVRKFREGKFAMPWANVVLEGDAAAATKELFEVAALPTQILVGADGVIVASGPELRGRGLEAEINRALPTKSKKKKPKKK